MMKLFESKKNNAYIGLSSGEKKKIIKKAIKRANTEQANVVKKYSVGKHEKCLMNS